MAVAKPAAAADPADQIAAALDRVAMATYPRYLVTAQMTDGSDPTQYPCHWEAEFPVAVAWLRYNYPAAGKITVCDLWTGEVRDL